MVSEEETSPSQDSFDVDVNRIKCDESIHV